MKSAFKAFLVAGLAGATKLAMAANADVVSSLDWIDRPWEYRYLLHVEPVDDFEFEAKKQRHIDYESDKGLSNVHMPGPFKLSWVVQRTDKTDVPDRDRFAVLRIDIKEDRTITTPNLWGLQLDARLNANEDIVLVPRIAKPDKIVRFGQFFMGSYAATDERYSPTICNQFFGDNVDPTDGIGRYVEKDFDPISHGYFGCREWAAQLYSRQRPYIDVTSYEYEIDYEKPELKSGPRKGFHPIKKPLTIEPRIVHFVGFSRFEDAPKPVIGNHEGQWLCLTDCPDGNAPGPITDIKAWAAKHGWPVPQRPKDVREFKDKKVKPGDMEE
jgi:hypothetical protein